MGDKDGAFYNANDLKNYRKKVEFYLKEHNDELAIFKQWKPQYATGAFCKSDNRLCSN